MMSQAIEDAKRYELYTRVKMYGDGYIQWASLGFIGSFLSYVFNVFGSTVGVIQSEIDTIVGSIWLFIIAYGLLTAFQLDPDELLSISTRQSVDEFKRYSKDIKQINSRIGIGWLLSFFIGMLVSYLLVSMFSGINGEPYLIGIGLSLCLGNLQLYFQIRDAISSLIVSIFILITLPFLILIASPYQMMILGIGMGGAYYAGGIWIRVHDIPQILKSTKEVE